MVVGPRDNNIKSVTMPLTLEELQGFQADAGVGSQRGRQLRFFHCTLPLVLLREGEGETGHCTLPLVLLREGEGETGHCKLPLVLLREGEGEPSA